MEVLPGIPGSELLCVQTFRTERGDHRLQLFHTDNVVFMESRGYHPISMAINKELRKVAKQHRRVTISSQAEAPPHGAYGSTKPHQRREPQ
ncbi:hypothetical protein P7K49_036321, partial [Saguinus oedipus]